MNETNTNGLIMVIDGGGSTCRARLVAADGTTFGAATGGAANPTSDPVAAHRAIVETARAAYADAGLDIARAPRDRLFLALAGISGRESFAGTLAADLSFARIGLTTDLEAGVEAALGPGDGVVVNIGTGSYFVARRGGQIRRIGGRGLVLSDECSGGWLGLNLLREVVRAADGRIATTPLTAQAMAHCGGRIEEVVAFARRGSPRDFAALTPMIVAARENGDPVAEDLFARGIAEMTTILEALDARALGRIVLVGGLAAIWRARLPDEWRALCHEPSGDTLDGAVALALRAMTGKGTR